MPEIILSDNEAIIGNHILKILWENKIKSINFKSKVANTISNTIEHSEYKNIPKERIIFVFIYCLGQYLSKLNESMALEYQKELDKFIDSKTFIMNPFLESKTNFIPDNWNELWELLF